MEITSRELQITSVRVLRGPNQWASFPVLEAVVDLGRLEDFPSHTIPGFNERVMGWLPTMIEHRCSIGERGGFFERLRTGTWMGHVLEHVTLELQSLAGCPAGYGRARETGTRGVYKVVVEFKEEAFGIECLHTAHRLLVAAIDGTAFDAAAEIKRLQKLLLEVQLGPSTRSIVEAAAARGIPARRLTEGSLVRLGQGAKQRRIIAAETDRTGAVAEAIAQDKELTRTLLAEAGIPVPEGRPVRDAADAWSVAEEIGAPVVVKPRYGNQGRGVSVDLSTREEVEKAWLVAREEESTVVVERFVRGGDYRVLVVGGKAVAAARRHPPRVVGDGVATVATLVERVNEDPRRCCDHAGALSPVRIDGVALAVLADQGLTPESVPAADRVVLLRQNANLSTGGTSEDVTDIVHPDVAARAVEAARIIGLDVAGIDIVTADITQSLESQRGVVIEVNAGPGLRMHLEPTVGTPRNVGAAIVDTLFAPGDQGRIPVAAVTGTNGKSTVVRLLSHLAATGGATVGTTCTEGIWIGGRQIDGGDCSGPASARRVLANPSVTTAVLETARGGILREGCGFDSCDVAVVTNIASGDHLGLGEIDTPERLAWVKGAVVAGVRPGGTAVLNAADPLVVGMKKWCKGQVVYFALDPANPLIVEHLAQGGLAATVRDGWIVLCDGPRETRLANLDRVPLVHRGLVAFQVENALAAAAAAWRLGVPLELVRLGLETFSSGSGGSPGRFNLLDLEGASIIVDYGHNVPSLEQICATVRGLPHPRRTAVYSAAGDRRDEDLVQQGRLLAATFDRVVIYEDAYIRGRQPGEITALISSGIRAAMRPDRVTTIEFGGTWCEAAALVLDAARAGDLVLLQPDTVEQTVAWLAERYGSRVQETQFDQMAGLVVRDADSRVAAPSEPVEVRSGRQGRAVVAVRDIAAGETVLKAWGPQAPRRSRHSMQVDVDTHILPDGVMVLVNHSCEPNCGVQIRPSSREIEVRALRPIAAGEEITFDYNTFEYELDHGGSQCTCGAATCRGRVPGFKHVAAEVRARYGEFIADYLRTIENGASLPVGA
ncbi:MAG: cyanophycin synthetase [Planctomycetia bacterium]|nr:cyanophycin synthetase [Planctomycetia bacterium]